MAEETKKPRTRKPKVEKPKEVVEEPEVVAEPSPIINEEPEVVAETSPVITKSEEEEPKVETTLDAPVVEKPTELPEEAPKFEDLKSPVKLQKLNPNLPDSKSKWVAFIPTRTGRHILFKGSYPKAARAAKNYNEAKGFPNPPQKIRSN